MSIKVGDKIKIVNANISGGRYQNGDVFTVHSVKEYGIVFVKEHDQCVWASEYEVIKETPHINVGDTVKLIDKFYEHEKFKSDSRHIRKQIASLVGKEFEVYSIDFGRAHTRAGIIYTIPIELLEKVEELPAKTISDEIEDLIEALVEVIKPAVEMATEIVKKLVEVYGVDLVETSKRIDQGMSFQEAIESMTKHRYTDEQIAEAERIIGEIVAGMAWRHQITFALVDGNIIALSWRDRYENTKQVFEAKCSPHDEYNETIGKMVCLCRATGRKLPDWIYV